VPAPVLFLSCEPLLTRIDLAPFFRHLEKTGQQGWVIAGGESGPRARVPDPAHFHHLKDQCQGAGVPFHFKQHGVWVDRESLRATGCTNPEPFIKGRAQIGLTEMLKVGKKKAGRVLAGRTWDEFPHAAGRPELLAFRGVPGPGQLELPL
jgi:protein gp37